MERITDRRDRSCELIFVRHAQARHPRGTYGADTPLTALGRDQAQAMAEGLRGSDVAALYSSPFVRARETAQPIGEALGLAPVEDDRLRELECMHEDEVWHGPTISDRIIRAWRADDEVYSGMERRRDFAGRVAESVQEIAERHVGDRVMVVGHGGTVDAAVRWLAGVEASAAWQHFLSVPNASVTRVRYWPTGYAKGGPPRYAMIVAAGDVSHLPEHLRSEH